MGTYHRSSGGSGRELVVPGKDPGGILTTSLIGVAGSFLATFLAHALERGQAAGFIASVIGGILLLSMLSYVPEPHSPALVVFRNNFT